MSSMLYQARGFLAAPSPVIGLCATRFQALGNPSFSSFVVNFVASFVDSLLPWHFISTNLTTKLATKGGGAAVSGRVLSATLFEKGLTVVAMAALAAFTPSSVRAAGPAPAVEADTALVQVMVTSQEVDPLEPWQPRQPGSRTGYGVFVGSNLVITTENLVRNQRVVQIRLPQRGERIRARVTNSDCQVNLALLRIADGDVPAGVVPLALCDTVSRDSHLDIMQVDETTRVQHGIGRLFQVNMVPLPHAPNAALTFSLLSDFNITGDGVPVLLDGRLAGLIMSYNWGTRTGNVIPAITLRQFTESSAASPYAGFASAGFMWAELVDPAKRKYLQVQGRTGGIVVVLCLPRSGAAASLRPQDVIIEWDGHPIDNLGFYQDSEFGRILFSCLVMNRRRPGDRIPVRIVRAGTEQTVEITLTRYEDGNAFVPENPTRMPPEYLIEGGLILRELDAVYLRTLTERQRQGDSRLTNVYIERGADPRNPGDHVVILASVLPDPINLGYQTFRDDIVTQVNGTTVHNMADVFRIADRDGGVFKVMLQGFGVELVLDRNELSAANARISRSYRIPALRYQRKDDGRNGG